VPVLAVARVHVEEDAAEAAIALEHVEGLDLRCHTGASGAVRKERPKRREARSSSPCLTRPYSK